MNEEERYKEAKKRVEELKGFYTHLGVYLIFAVAAIAVWAITGATGWYFWPLAMWGHRAGDPRDDHLRDGGAAGARVGGAEAAGVHGAGRQRANSRTARRMTFR